MAFKDFPQDQYFRTLNSDQVTRLGFFNVASGIEMTEMMLTLFVKGLIVTSFQMRVNVYGNDDQASPIFSSAWATLDATTLLNNDVDPPIPYVGSWLGNVYFDFNGYPLNPNINYFFSVETLGYTRVGDSFYLGTNLDWYSPVNNQLDGPNEAGARIRVLGLTPT
jgi:hypothetical protein